MGNPIAHSLSPFIHREFACQFNINLEYNYLQVESNQLNDQITNFCVSGGGRGINLTAPLKELAINLVHNLSSRARISAAINTISIKGNELFGDNTDGIGFIRDLTLRHKFNIYNKHILILGAGGATRGILPLLVDNSPASISIVNRDLEKARALCNGSFGFGEIMVLTYPEIIRKEFDLIINATSGINLNFLLDLSPKFKFSSSFFYDLNYGVRAEALGAYAGENGSKTVINGLGMLVEQAAESFYIWHGLRPQTDIVLELLLHTTPDQKDLKNVL